MLKDYVLPPFERITGATGPPVAEMERGKEFHQIFTVGAWQRQSKENFSMKTKTMTAPAPVKPGFVLYDNVGAACRPDDVRTALAGLLARKEFSRAQRMSRLLRFLVDKSLTGAVRETSEYAIGIDVFDRDPASYSTGEDPIVRIQVGRLREKLRAYYAGAGAGSTLRFVIPLGSYMPAIVTSAPPAPALPDAGLFTMVPLTHLSADPVASAFAQGLSEELGFQLFKGLGHKMVSHRFAADAAVRLEGSIRVDAERIRATLRLVDAGAGCITWAEQFDRSGPCAITVQEELAITVCSALKQHFARTVQG